MGKSVWPAVTIQICTYNRWDEIRRTLVALRRNLIYPEESLRWLICDDSTPGDYRERVFSFMRNELGVGNFGVITTPQNGGWGANVNNGLRRIDTPYIFFVEDDYLLTRELNLQVGIALLERNNTIGLLRYRAIAGDTNIICFLHETDIGTWLPDYCHGLGLPGKLAWWRISPRSESLWLYSHGPHLKTRGFHQYYGNYPEGLKLGATEEAFAHQVKDAMRANPYAPALAILPEWVTMHWEHIGQSYQQTELDNQAGKIAL